MQTINHLDPLAPSANQKINKNSANQSKLDEIEIGTGTRIGIGIGIEP